MARKSRKVDYVNVGNKENLVTEAENQCEKVSHAALYARLSYESEKNRERNTIETQMVLLHNFVKEQKDIVVAKEYYDISKTGTNFERDGFNEMMQDIKEGNIDCVIVKDLSRLGRNYVEAGSYIERVFPFFNVRFISVNDHYDSFRDDISLLISMSNVYNEFYSRDLAKKIRSSYRTSWANGEFPSGQMAYGYEKDKDNPHQLIPDPVAAPVVKKIFQYFIDGMTYAEIARKLNADGYLCPKAYKLDKAGKANEKSATWTWSGGTVHKILENQYYAGDSVHNQFTNDSWAAQRQKMNQKEEWIIIKNTHEALVSRKDFDEVQEKIGHIVKRVNEARKSNGNNVRDFNFFKQKIVCADCGKTMYLYGKTKGSHRRFYCGNNKLHGKCTPHSITDLEVNDYVLRVIRAHINVYVENVDLIRRLNQRQESIKKYDVFNREIKKCRKELEKVAVHRERLFEDYVCRIIDAEQYETFSKQDAETEKEIQNNMEILLKHQVGYEKNFHTEEEWETLINKYRNTRTLTKEMVNAFVEKIEIHEALKGRTLADYRGKKVGYLFQNFELLDNLTGRENILLPTSLHGIPEKESSQRLSQLAKYLEINDVLDKFPSKMSGGQRQRVAAARALILNPRMILADEPTGALDSKNARNIMEKLSGLNCDEQATILMVTHDSNAASFCKRILFIQDGIIFHELRQLPGDFYYCLLYDSFHLHPGCNDFFAKNGERCSEQTLASDSCVLRNDPGDSFLFDLLRLQVSI